MNGLSPNASKIVRLISEALRKVAAPVLRDPLLFDKITVIFVPALKNSRGGSSGIGIVLLLDSE